MLVSDQFVCQGMCFKTFISIYFLTDYYLIYSIQKYYNHYNIHKNVKNASIKKQNGLETKLKKITK